MSRFELRPHVLVDAWARLEHALRRFVPTPNLHYIAASLAREWFDTQKVDAILDVAASATALAHSRSRPYRLPLTSAALPEAVLSGLADDEHPGALWGEWFGGGLVVGPESAGAAQALNLLNDLNRSFFFVSSPFVGT